MVGEGTSAPTRSGGEPGNVGRHVRVVSLEPKDQWNPIDNIRSIFFLIVRATLDIDALRDALDRLIRHHVPVLSARIAGRRGSLVYRQPDPLPPDTSSERHGQNSYALFGWPVNKLDETFDLPALLPLAESSDASGKERGNGSPSSAGGSGSGSSSTPGASFGPVSIPELETRWTPLAWPRERRNDQPDTPLLLVHLTCYRDATVVSTNLPHAVVDQMGYGSLLRAWLAIVAGRTPQPFLSLEPDSLRGATQLPLTELRRRHVFRITSRLDRAVVLAGFLPDLMINRHEQRRLLYLPSALVDSLRTRHGQALSVKYGPDQPALTNGDIVSGILAKLANLGRKRPKMTTVSSTINICGRHPALPVDQPYLHNCVTYAVARLPLSRDTPLAELTYQNRLAVCRGLEPASIERGLAVTRELHRRGYVIHICEPLERSYSITNWCGAWRGLDFGPAVLPSDPAAIAGQAASALPIVLGHSLERKFPTRYNSQVMCKAEGGYWCDFTASDKVMPLVDRLLSSDPQLQHI